MAANLLDGKQLAARIREDVAEQAEALQKDGWPLKLAALLATDDPGARIYAGQQQRTCRAVGIEYELYPLSAQASEQDLLAAVDRLNADPAVTGIMIHVPLPEGVDAVKVHARVVPEKDVEGTGPASLGLLMHRKAILLPCTPAAAVELVKASGVTLQGARAVVIGRSTVVGKPLALMLTDAHCTVTVCHTRTKDLKAVSRSADILCVAAGKPALVDAEYVKPGAVVVDVGINQVTEPGPDGQPKTRTVGDVDSDSVSRVAGHLSPVPGGVGPVTVAMLLRNVILAARAQRGGS